MIKKTVQHVAVVDGFCEMEQSFHLRVSYMMKMILSGSREACSEERCIKHNLLYLCNEFCGSIYDEYSGMQRMRIQTTYIYITTTRPHHPQSAVIK
jgi:hypothetical protein